MAMRIVPLYPAAQEEDLAELAPAPAIPPRLQYNGGPLLTNVKVFTLFWGGAWQNDQSLVQRANDLNAFFTFVVTSPLIDQLAEYSVNGFTIGQGSFLGTATLTDADPNLVTTDADVQALLNQEIANNPAVPQPDANTLYFVYLPSGVTSEMQQGQSCSNYCGYHSDINGQVFYAVMPDPDCNGQGGCTGGLSSFDALTGTSSHELCEAITDPIVPQGWYDPNNGEIGDICAWQFKQVGPYNVQLEWSNQQNSCL